MTDIDHFECSCHQRTLHRLVLGIRITVLGAFQGYSIRLKISQYSPSTDFNVTKSYMHTFKMSLLLTPVELGEVLGANDASRGDEKDLYSIVRDEN